MVRADLLARVRHHEDRFEIVAEAVAEIAHRAKLSAKARADRIRKRQLNEAAGDLVVETLELVQMEERRRAPLMPGS